jgi:hypothetical protein
LIKGLGTQGPFSLLIKSGCGIIETVASTPESSLLSRDAVQFKLAILNVLAKYPDGHAELDVKIKHYSLRKKADREDVILKTLKALERSPATIIAVAKESKKKKAKLPKSPIKESKLPVTGD